MRKEIFFKKIKFFAIIGFFALIMPVISAQSTYSELRASEEDVVIKRERTFEGEALYGFMNGGSELYLEYDFEELRALDVLYKGEEYSIELYKMASAEDAFGIYSQHTYRCIVADRVYQADCSSRYQMQSVIGDTYISVVYSKPVEGFNEKAVELTEYFSKDIERKEFDIPAEIELDNNISGTLKMFKGPIALNNNAPEFLEKVSGVDKYTIWSYDSDKGRKILIITPDSRICEIYN